ncbi:MAG: CPBP family intramembrane metalloprotease [Lachnospiraceae bacterium]|nr:CPBP family intramembrane metalloprotease [Lachnospiraceae bacterium]
MTAKRSGWVFFIMTMAYVIAPYLLLIGNIGERMTVSGVLWMSEGIVLIPALLFAICSKDRLRDTMAFHKIRIPTIFLAALHVALLGPLLSLCNLVTMLVVDNTATEILSLVSEISYGKLFFFVGLLAPVCEEIVFRGILYTGFRKNGTPMQAILWTAVLFGLFHMNLNQMVYAAVLGFAFGLLREATGNIWAGIIGHISLNSYSVLMYYLESILLTEELAGTENTLTQDTLLVAIGVYLIIALITTALAVCVLVAIAKLENGKEYLRQVFTKKERGRIWSVPLWIGIMICVGTIVLDIVVSMGILPIS